MWFGGLVIFWDVGDVGVGVVVAVVCLLMYSIFHGLKKGKDFFWERY